MKHAPITQQTSVTLPLGAELARAAPEPPAASTATFGGALQWALEGRGWTLLRPASDFLAISAAVLVAQRASIEAGRVQARQAPLLALPLVVLLLFYLRGLYRTRLRALVLDGVVPVLSAVSIALMVLVTFGVFVNGAAPGAYAQLKTWGFALVAVGAGLPADRAWNLPPA